MATTPLPHLRRALLVAAALLCACGGSTPGPAAREVPRTPGGSGGVNAPQHRDAPYVVMISVDGFRWDYMERHEAPTFARVASEGARAERLIPVFPTKTFPTHYSLATGLYTEHHGLVGNAFWDPDRGAGYAMYDRDVVEDGSWYGGEPLWVTAETQGMVAASFFWVGSEADVKGVRPTHWNRYDGSVTRETRVDRVLEWLSAPAESRPHMINLYFSAVDGAGHRHGPDSEEVAAAVAGVDAALARLLEGIDALPHGDRVYVVLVSDHGMLRAEAERAAVLDPDAFPGVRWAEGGPYASFFVEEGGAARAVQVRDSLRAMVPSGRFWLREEVPERFHYSADPRIGDVVGLMDPGATLVPPDRVPDEDSWTHGWDNRIEEMGAIFLIRGPGIEGGQRIEPFEAVHVYPLVTHLLGLEPADVDGRLEVLAPLLDGSR